jgi:hypothetical protein
MSTARPLLVGVLALAVAACGTDSAGPGSPAGAGAPAQRTEADLVSAIRGTFESVGDVRYFDASYDLNGDSSPETVVYLAGPDVCGTGGCPVLVFTPGADGYRLVTSISVSRPPIRVSPRSSQGWRNLIVAIGGGGLSAGDAELKFDGKGYASNPTVPPAETPESLDGAETLIGPFDNYTEGKPVAAATSSGAAGVFGDPTAPLAGTVLGVPIHTKDAEELRYFVLKALTDRYARDKGIAVTQAERDAYIADLQAFVARERAKDPNTGSDMAVESADDRAAREEIATGFITQWKVNRALYQQYGGRIVYQQGGPEPLEAYRRFLEENQARGDFQITDAALEASFWRYYRDDSIHSFYKSGSEEELRVFAAPPWRSSVSEPPAASGSE